MTPRLLRGLRVGGYAALALGTFALVLFGLRPGDDAIGTSEGAAGSPAPGFDLEQLDGSGRLALASYSGQTVVVNFWASWCGPCEDEADDLEQSWRQWSKQDVTFIGIDSRDSTAAAARFVDDHGMTYPVAADEDGAAADDYGVAAMPQTFVISPAGTITHRFIGPVTQSALAEALATAPGSKTPDGATSG